MYVFFPIEVIHGKVSTLEWSINYIDKKIQIDVVSIRVKTKGILKDKISSFICNLICLENGLRVDMKESKSCIQKPTTSFIHD